MFVWTFILLLILDLCTAANNRNITQGRIKRALFSVKDQFVDVGGHLSTSTQADGEYRYPCYVKIIVYTSPDRKSFVSNAQVTLLARERHSTDHYIGFSQETTDTHGRACVLALCKKTAIVFVTSGQERLYALHKSRQPSNVGLPYQFQSRDEELVFDPRLWHSSGSKSGLVYGVNEKAKCLKDDESNFHFAFSFLSVKESLTATALPLSTIYEPLSWEYQFPAQQTHQSCFIKIKVVTNSSQSILTLGSYQVGRPGSLYGKYIAGPKEDPLAQDNSIKAACLQYRCAQKDIHNINMDTKLIATMSVPSHPGGCCYKIAQGLQNMTVTSSGFELTIHTDDNYGPYVGIYKHWDVRYARSKCYTGHDFLLPSYDMDPTTNYAVMYDCLNCNHLGPVLG